MIPSYNLSACRWLLALSALVAMLVPAAAQTATLPLPPPHVRIFNNGLSNRIADGMRGSPTLRGLHERIESEPILVFVDCNSRLPMRLGARMLFVAAVNGGQFLRVELDCWLADRQLVGMLAHELQHVLEVASRPDIVDNESMQSFYESNGFETSNDGWHATYETEAAIAVEHQVLSELNRREPREPAR